MVLDVNIPESIGNLKLPEPEVLNYYEQADRRTIWLDFEVSSSLTEIGKRILLWNYEDADHGIEKEKRDPIRLMIFSPGGDEYAMWHLIDTIQASETPIYTYNMGLAASAGCAIMLAGHKRYALEHSTFMWHSGSGGIEGTMSQVECAASHFKALEKFSHDYLMAKTKVDVKTYRRQKDKDWYITAQEALEYGFIDGIITSVADIFGGGR